MNSSIFKTFFISLAVIANTHFAYCQTASILPNAKTTFTDQNGKPLTSGTVDFYVPTTTTRKTTWQDSSKSVSNTNPVVLDAAGRALIWGDGAYRQVVKDRYGNLIWDQVTSSIGTGGSSTTTVGDGLPVGSILPNSGFIAPANYQFAYGQALSRSTYSNLFAALTISTSIGCVGGSPLVNVSDTSNLSVGAVLESICVTGSPTIISKTSTSVTLSSNSTITVATTGTFFPYGNGDALTTFNVPDLRGYVVAGRCNMGGVDCSNLNSTYFSSNINNTPSGVNAKGGSQSLAVLQANLPNIAFPVNDPGHAHGGSFRMGTSTSGGAFPYAGSFDNTSFSYTTNSAVTNITVRSGGSGTPISLVQPTATLNYVVKVLPDSNLTSTFGVGSIGGMTGVIACGSGVTCAGNTISFSFSGVNSIQGMSGNITCGSGLTCSGNSISTTSANPQVLSSRTAAAALDLSPYAAVETLGYSRPGDGGGAVFQKNSGSIVTISITTAGTGCTNSAAGWSGIYFTGGSGRNAQATVTVAGNVATAIALSGAGGAGLGYTAGNVLTAVNVPGCSVQPTFTINSIGAAPFIDSQVTSLTISNAGTGCTPGTYFGFRPTGGVGSDLEGNVVIGGGGTMTSFTSTGTGGGGYRVGNVLTFIASSPAIPGCSTQPSLTVATINSPQGSFIDTAGNGWQIIPANGSATANIRQFGAVQNYVNGKGDAGATDDGAAIQSCLRFMAVGSWYQDAGGWGGGTCVVPSGASLVCNGLQVPAYVALNGVSMGGSVLKQCDSDNVNTTHFITLGDPQNHHNAFNATLKNLTLFGGGTSAGTAYMVYSNSTQSANTLEQVAIYGVARGCIKYEIGYGGPSGFGVHGGYCVPNGALSPSPAITLSGNFTFTFDNNWHTSVGGPQWAGTVIALGNGGSFIGSGIHCENITICIDYDGSGGAPMMVSLIGNVGHNVVNKWVSIRNGSITGVNLQGFVANGVACNVYKVATASCVSTGNIPGLTAF